MSARDASLIALFLAVAWGCAADEPAAVDFAAVPNPETCRSGMVDVGAGRCCWPGQRWDADRRTCGGQADCPDGLFRVVALVLPEDCVQLDCPLGMSRWIAEGPCCWPGQWPLTVNGIVSDACHGQPACPFGSELADEGCRPTIRWIPIEAGTVPSPNRDEVSIGGGPFEIAQSPTTSWHYFACVQDGACPAPHQEKLGVAPRLGAPGTLSLPAVGADHDGAADFCAWVGGRLPTHAEWLYASMAGDSRQRAFPWGDEPHEVHFRDELWRQVCTDPVPLTPRGLCGVVTATPELVVDGFSGSDVIEGDWAKFVPAAGYGRDFALGSPFRCIRDVPAPPAR